MRYFLNNQLIFYRIVHINLFLYLFIYILLPISTKNTNVQFHFNAETNYKTIQYIFLNC